MLLFVFISIGNNGQRIGNTENINVRCSILCDITGVVLYFLDEKNLASSQCTTLGQSNSSKFHPERSGVRDGNRSNTDAMLSFLAFAKN